MICGYPETPVTICCSVTSKQSHTKRHQSELPKLYAIICPQTHSVNGALCPSVHPASSSNTKDPGHPRLRLRGFLLCLCCENPHPCGICHSFHCFPGMASAQPCSLCCSMPIRCRGPRSQPLPCEMLFLVRTSGSCILQDFLPLIVLAQVSGQERHAHMC